MRIANVRLGTEDEMILFQYRSNTHFFLLSLGICLIKGVKFFLFMKCFTNRHTLYLLILFLLVFNYDAKAYLDPGTGSIILQLLAAGLLSALFYFKSFWRKLKS